MRRLSCAALLLSVPLALAAQAAPPDTLAVRQYAQAYTQAIAYRRHSEPLELRAERLGALTPPSGYESLHHDVVLAARRLAFVTTQWRLSVGDDPVVCDEGLSNPPGGCRPLPATGEYGDRRQEALARWRQATAAMKRALDHDLPRLAPG